jgi:hypothetical protein
VLAESVSDYDATLYGTRTLESVALRVGSTGSVLLDGATGYAVLGTQSLPIFPTAALTAEAWVVSLNAPTDHASVLSCTQSGGWSLFKTDEDRLRFIVRVNGAYLEASADLALHWDGVSPLHAACVYDGRYARLYIDGEEVASDDAGAVFPIQYGSSLVPLMLGAEAQASLTVPSSGNFLAGNISDVALYGRALTAQEIAERYSIGINGPTPGTPGTPGTDPIPGTGAIYRVEQTLRETDYEWVLLVREDAD